MTRLSLSDLTLLVPIASFMVTWVVLSMLLRTFSNQALDHPNERSLHEQPVPRMGGIGVTAGIAVCVPLVSPPGWWPLWFGAALLMAISLLDDFFGLPIIARLVMHFVTAGGFVVFQLSGQMEVGWAFVAMMAIVWMINLYNFMDGMDGLAGGMALFGFGFLAIAAYLGGNGPFTLVNASIACGAAAFLLFNFHPARIFLGDAGSTTLGFLAAGLGLMGWQKGVWSLWFPLLVFSPFIVDATVTLFRRILKGEKFWLAHRSHCYQRLVLSGWGQQRTVLTEYGLMVFCGIIALSYHQTSSDRNRVILLAIWLAVCILFVKAVDNLHHQQAGQSLP